MKTKSQISLVILFGLVLLIAFSFLFYFEGLKKEVNIEMPASFLPINSFVESCIEKTGKEAIIWIGEHGGYYNLDNVYSTDFTIYNTAYYFNIKDNLAPSKERVEKEISDYINDNLFFCLQNFVDFKEQGFDIIQGNIDSSVQLSQDDATFSVYLPLAIKKQENVKKIENFAVNIKTKLGSMLTSAHLLAREQVNDPGNICMSCIFRESMKNDFIIELSNIGNDTVIVDILDNATGQQLIYANKYMIYSCTNPPFDAEYSFYEKCLNENIQNLNYSFYVEDIPDFEIQNNENFYYKINASGYNLSFNDYTSLFDINNKTGVINFTPTEEEIGNHSVWISLKDKFGNEDYAEFEMQVKE